MSTLFIIGGIEKEKHTISNSVLIFGLITQTIYIIYLYILNISIYKYVIYIFLAILLSLINMLIFRKQKKQDYTISMLALCFYLATFSMEKLMVITIIVTLLSTTIKEIIILCKKDKTATVEIPIGFYLCFTNAIAVILHNYII